MAFIQTRLTASLQMKEEEDEEEGVCRGEGGGLVSEMSFRGF